MSDKPMTPELRAYFDFVFGPAIKRVRENFTLTKEDLDGVRRRAYALVRQQDDAKRR